MYTPQRDESFAFGSLRIPSIMIPCFVSKELPSKATAALESTDLINGYWPVFHLLVFFPPPEP
jgi:hypothetical protein